jgi:uncharacterized protein YbjT (DUF2867 family)
LTIRAITRNPSSPSAQSLKSLGADVIHADLNDKSSLERAFKDANYIFSVTNFFETLSVQTEITQGINAIDAACSVALNTIESFIWSTLPDPRTFPIPYENVLHFNTKAEISKHLRRSPLWDVSTEIWVSAYFQNYIKFRETYGPQKQEDGSFIVTLPVNADTAIDICDVNDLGLLVEKIISEPLHYHTETILLSTQTLTPGEQMEIWASSLGVKAEFIPTSFQTYVVYLVEHHGFPHQLALEMGENFACYKDNPEMWTRKYGNDEHEHNHDHHVIKSNEVSIPAFDTELQYNKRSDLSNRLFKSDNIRLQRLEDICAGNRLVADLVKFLEEY